MHTSQYRYNLERVIWERIRIIQPDVSTQHDHLPVLVELLDASFVILTQPRAERFLSDVPFSMAYLRHVAGALNIALTTLHAAGILHMDINDTNVLITKDDLCFLNDFSCSQIIESGLEYVVVRDFVGTDNFSSNSLSIFRSMSHSADQRLAVCYGPLDDYKSLVLLLLNYCSCSDDREQPKGLPWMTRTTLADKWLVKKESLENPAMFIFPRIDPEALEFCRQLFEAAFVRGDVISCQSVLTQFGMLVR